MAETNPQNLNPASTPSVETPVKEVEAPAKEFTKADATAKLNAAISFYSKYAGKRGYNPHFKLNELHSLGKKLDNADTVAAACISVANLPSPQESDVYVKGMEAVREADKKQAATTKSAPVTDAVGAALKK